MPRLLRTLIVLRFVISERPIEYTMQECFHFFVVTLLINYSALYDVGFQCAVMFHAQQLLIACNNKVDFLIAWM
jgi:hypothetical protein